jgi:hypothetical protein
MIETMVSFQERIVLRNWVALNWQAKGEIVEIGAFAGGSAVAILQGMEDSRRQGYLHVYDTFKFPVGGHEATYRKLLGQPEGESFAHRFLENVAPWSPRVVMHRSDASQAKWNGNPIEILHLDCSISREFHEAVAREFYPYLTKNACVIHQDYTYENATFIPQMMEKLERFFSKTLQVETSQYFRTKTTPKKEELEDALAEKRLQHS